MDPAGFPHGDVTHVKVPPSQQTSEPRNKPHQHRRRGQHERGRKDRHVVAATPPPPILQTSGHHTHSGGKKVSLTHLLNFKFSERDTAGGMLLRRQRVTPFVRERFVQANFRFAVAEGATDYTFFLADPDRLVDWNHVELVMLTTHETITCPICLYQPIAAKITKCGHTFCWPCLLQYLAQMEKGVPQRRCPLCHEIVRPMEAKSVVIIERPRIQEGNTARFQLMQRLKGNTIVQPRSRWRDFAPGQLPRATDHCASLCKLSAADKETLQTALEREQRDLSEALAQCESLDPLAEPFILTALDRLMVRKKAFESNASKPTESPAVDLSDEEPTTAASAFPQPHHSISTSPRDLSSPRARSNSGDVEHGEPRRLLSEGDVHMFYQSEDGQLVFLHPVNVKMLLRQHGSASSCPDIVEGRVLEVWHLTMTEAQRKRWRHLDHLPLSCEFDQVELDLSGVLSESVMKEFADELKKRERQRQRVQREQREAAARGDVEMRKQLEQLQKRLAETSHVLPEPDAPGVDFVMQEVVDPQPQQQMGDAWSVQPASFRDIVRGPQPLQDVVLEGGGRSFLQALREDNANPEPAATRGGRGKQQKGVQLPPPRATKKGLVLMSTTSGRKY